jgi:hypothetical protein
MKSKILAMLFSCFMLILSGCDSPCAATPVYVGGFEGRNIALIDESGQAVDRVQVDANGYVSVPCGLAVGGGQIQ